MSAFIVSDEHIDAILDFVHQGSGLSYHWGEMRSAITSGNVDEIGQVLVNENYRSVNWRYHENNEPHEYHFTFRNAKHSAVQVLKLLDSYDYQACETEDWPATHAHAITAAIRGRMIGELPGYEKAKWSLR